MMLRSRSCVIGRGVAMFSIWSAIAFASKMPTQIGSTRSPCLSFRITMGRLVIGSTISPLMLISISMVVLSHGLAGQTMRSSSLDRHTDGAANPSLQRVSRNIGRERDVHYRIPRRAPRDLPGPPAAGGVDQHVRDGSHR